MSTDANTAASSAAPETPPSFSDYEAEANAADLAGAPLRSTLAPTPPADPSPATPVDQAATDAQSETPPADPSPAKPEKKAQRLDSRTWDVRGPELLVERGRERDRADRAERELAELRRQLTQPKDATPAAPSAAPAPAPSFPTYDAYLAEHPDASYEDYIDARSDFRVEQTLKREREQAARSEQESKAHQHIRERDEQCRERIKAAEQENPDFRFDNLSDNVKALKPREALVLDQQSGRWRDPESGQFVLPGRIALAEALLESPMAPALMQHFSDHPEDVDRIVRLPPDEFFEAMGVIKHRVSTDSKKPAATPPKHVSDAPPPPSTLGKRPTTPADAVESALASGDYSAFEAAANARDLAAAASGRR